MSRILLADDSPHAQRMGERILRDEGFEVVSLTDGNAAMLRLADVDPDLILADVFLPGKSGFELCRHVKNEPRFKHVRVVLTAGLLEPFDEDEAKRAGCDAILKKPFEASKVVSTIDPLVKEAQLARSSAPEAAQTVAEPPKPERAPSPKAALTEPLRTGAEPSPSAAGRVLRPTEAPATAEPPLIVAAEPAPMATEAAPTAEQPPPRPSPSSITVEAAPNAAGPGIDPERVRAAVTLALDAALPAMIQEITERVLIALGH